jgi:hypothetical protein
LLLAKQTCIALQQLSNIKREKGKLYSEIVDHKYLDGISSGSLAAPHPRFPAKHSVFEKIVEFVITPTESREWFGFAQ